MTVRDLMLVKDIASEVLEVSAFPGVPLDRPFPPEELEPANLELPTPAPANAKDEKYMDVIADVSDQAEEIFPAVGFFDPAREAMYRQWLMGAQTSKKLQFVYHVRNAAYIFVLRQLYVGLPALFNEASRAWTGEGRFTNLFVAPDATKRRTDGWYKHVFDQVALELEGYGDHKGYGEDNLDDEPMKNEDCIEIDRLLRESLERAVINGLRLRRALINFAPFSVCPRCHTPHKAETKFRFCGPCHDLWLKDQAEREEAEEFARLEAESKLRNKHRIQKPGSASRRHRHGEGPAHRDEKRGGRR